MQKEIQHADAAELKQWRVFYATEGDTVIQSMRFQAEDGAHAVEQFENARSPEDRIVGAQREQGLTLPPPLVYIEVKNGGHSRLARIEVTDNLLREVGAATKATRINAGWVTQREGDTPPVIQINPATGELCVKDHSGGESQSFRADVLKEVVYLAGNAKVLHDEEADDRGGDVIDEDRFVTDWGAHGPDDEGIYEYAHVAKLDPKNVWSVVDADDGSLIATAGFHVVNVIGYVVTSRPWVTGNEQAIWWADRPAF